MLSMRQLVHCLLILDKFGKRSDTTLSSPEELQTPSTNDFRGFHFQLEDKYTTPKPVEGPVGPHLFRVSQETTQDVEFYLSMSPPVSPEHYRAGVDVTAISHTLPQRDDIPLGGMPLALWTPLQVARWMQISGFDESMIEKFRNNDISGAILMDLQFNDLKELGILSFGQRHTLWSEIRTLRGGSVPSSPLKESCRTPSISCKQSVRDQPTTECSSPATPEGDQPTSPKMGQRRARRPRRQSDDIISPAESASIVAIEQLLPKPHKCSKGENCSKWQKQQRKLAKIAKEFPNEFKQIGDAYSSPVETLLRPTSEAVPSVVASSDLLGPAQLPTLRLDEDVLKIVKARDPQENVRQFLSFQHMAKPIEEPTTPPYEMFPPLSPPANVQGPHGNLRHLPKLTIPDASPVELASPNRTAIRRYHSQKATPVTAMAINDYSLPEDIYRIGSPASAMDVPMTAIPVGPIERDISQSVPPDMRFGGGNIVRSTSRLEHRRQASHSMAPSNFAPIQRSMSHASRRPHPSFAMSPVDEHVLSPIDQSGELTPTISDINYAGWMKKRKTKMLRHEWHENHFRLNGTCLAMHRDEHAMDALECIDVDEYAVACSSIASNKLGTAFKSLKLSGKKKDGDVAAFSFQLVPAGEKKGILHAATGKTHHFAVKGRDERIDWMRELMLAKALKQKGEGFEVHVNGNMI